MTPHLKNYFKHADDLSNVFAITLALRLGIFEIIEQLGGCSPKSLLEKANYKTGERQFIDFLDELFVHGYLSRQGELDKATYRNSDYTKKYFLKDSPDTHYFIYHNLYRYLNKFDQMEKNFSNGKTFKYTDDIYTNEDSTKAYFQYFYRVNQQNFNSLLEKIDFSKYRRILDIHGGKGVLATMIKKKFPQCDVISFENSQMKKCAEEYVRDNQMHEALRLEFGDITNVKLPTDVDLVIAPHILMHYSCDNKNAIMKNVYNCLRPGGELLMLENLISTREKESHGLKISFMFSILGYEGSAHSFEEYRECLMKNGFNNFDHMRNAHGLSDIILAKK